MKFDVRVGQRTLLVEIVAGQVIVDGRAGLAELEGGGLFRRLVMDGHALPVSLVRGGRGWDVYVSGERLAVEVMDERARWINALTVREAGSSGAEVVRAPMPGLVLSVDVERGASISMGSGVLVLEAMKMENEIRAPRDGVVTEVLVDAGDTVEKGSPLVEIGPLPS